jgi:hypothetical protein
VIDSATSTSPLAVGYQDWIQLSADNVRDEKGIMALKFGSTSVIFDLHIEEMTPISARQSLAIRNAFVRIKDEQEYTAGA